MDSSLTRTRHCVHASRPKSFAGCDKCCNWDENVVSSEHGQPTSYIPAHAAYPTVCVVCAAAHAYL